ncbi:MAG: cell division protein ZipA C-terminal FtsZ-binding domain-containing protein [Nitrosomonadales bacterium]|nr:cell division protein ZipA C-terminal FtsZ-binding domain-containing protein [Nitrosomonadales bacterium]
MNELQISLLAVGVIVVLAVLGYNWRQQRSFKRKYGTVFEPAHADALTSETAARFVDEPVAGPLADKVEHALEEDVAEEEVAAAIALSHGANAVDGVSIFPDAATDYVTVLSFLGPESAHALAPLWQQRFDFGKTVYACGLNAAGGEWEKVIPESLFSYYAFKLSLQLADRAGAVSEARLEDFRNLVRDIAARFQAQAELPDVAAAAARAVQLDSFCADVDQVIGLNIVPNGERKFSGGDVARAAGLHGMSLQADGSFHMFDAGGHTLFSLANYGDAPFQHHTLNQMWVDGLTLLMDVPRVEHPVQRFVEMAVLARQLAMDLHAAVVDDNHVALGEPGIAHIRKQISAIESQMQVGGIPPGSVQARRLFS